MFEINQGIDVFYVKRIMLSLWIWKFHKARNYSEVAVKLEERNM